MRSTRILAQAWTFEHPGVGPRRLELWQDRFDEPGLIGVLVFHDQTGPARQYPVSLQDALDLSNELLRIANI